MQESVLTPGTVFAGRYRVLGQIGSGGFGAVYEAVHLVTERHVAVKTLWPHFAKDAVSRARFLREAKLATQVGSEYIVSVLDAGVDEATDMPFLVMELLEGESLNLRVERKKTFNPDETLVYLSQVAVALDRTHTRGVVHRDLKPANLFLTQRHDGSPLVKILDFGIAKLVASSGMEASNTLGTPLYMAPEQFTQSAVTPAVDVYALGLIAFRFLAGASYFKLEQHRCQTVYLLGATLAKGPQEAASLRARRYGGTLPPSFDAWFACAAHVSASERFPTARAAVLALAEVYGIPARPPLVNNLDKRQTGAISFMAANSDDKPMLRAVETRRSVPESAAPVSRVTALAGTAVMSDREPERQVLPATLMAAMPPSVHTAPASATEPVPLTSVSLTNESLPPAPASMQPTFIATVDGLPVVPAPTRSRSRVPFVLFTLASLLVLSSVALVYGVARFRSHPASVTETVSESVPGAVSMPPAPSPTPTVSANRPSPPATAENSAPIPPAKTTVQELPRDKSPAAPKPSAGKKASPEDLWHRE